MKIKNIVTVLLVAFILASCAPAAKVVPTETTISTLTFTPTLPATLTPISPIATSTPIQLQSFTFSESDMTAIETAETNIPLYRQGDLLIKLQDESENPLSGYVIEYEQITHDFEFGVFDDPPSQIQYLRPAGFNAMTLNIWWTLAEPEENKFNLEFVNGYRNVEELSSGGLHLKGQDIFSMSDEALSTPSYLRELSFDGFLEAEKFHLTNLVGRFAPYISRWEAILEPDLTYHNPFRLTKEQYLTVIKTAVDTVRANDPDSLIEINFAEPCQPRMKEMLADILNAGIDFDVVGLQFYYNAYILPEVAYQPPKLTLTEINQCLDEYENLVKPYGKRIAGSEVAIPSETPANQPGYWGQAWSEDSQAQYLQAIYKILFSKPTNLTITYWDGVDSSSFIANSGLIDDNGNPKKAFWVLKDLLQSWTTEGEAITDSNGEIKVKGFGGKYQLLITNPENGSSMTFQAELKEQNSAISTITFLPNGDLLESVTKLQKLIDYWESEGDETLVLKGRDFLSLAQYHISKGERKSAEQVLIEGLNELAIKTEFTLKGVQFKGYLLEGINHHKNIWLDNGDVLLWSSDTAYYKYDFPAGKTTLNIRVRGTKIDGKYPTMIVGIGDKYSFPIVVNENSETYTIELPTTGNEKILTIRFLYEDSSNPGEWKLFINQVDVTIMSDKISNAP